MKLTSRKDDVIPAILRQKLQTFLIILINQFVPKVLADDFLVNSELIFKNVWNLKEH